MPIEFVVDGSAVQVDDDGSSLLTALREELGLRSVKDGCSPQGQCGCCTVLVDGQPRVSCVTPVRRMAGRQVTTLEGLDADVRDAWASALCESGGSQCGFCTPGIVVRLAALQAKGAGPGDGAAVNRALAAHLCRCTGWQTITEAWVTVAGSGRKEEPAAGPRDLDRASRRAGIESGGPQQVAPVVALGRGGFADDTAPSDALVGVRGVDGSWVVRESLAEARTDAGKVQGRRTSLDARPPLDLPPGSWDRTLRTSWVDPAYLETDATWCEPGGDPASALANAGAFGAKQAHSLGSEARRLADEHGRAVRLLWSREDVVRLGVKRPPIAAGIMADGSGVMRVARTPGIAEVVASVAPDLAVEERDLAGPPTSAALRGAGWAEAVVLLAGVRGLRPVRAPSGAVAEAELVDGAIQVRVSAGEVLDSSVMRAYAVGAAHMAFGWVTSEGLVVDEDGEVQDLTIRSFGVPRAMDTPPIEVEVVEAEGPPVQGSDAVFAAVASAIWCHQGCPPDLPTRQRL